MKTLFVCQALVAADFLAVLVLEWLYRRPSPFDAPWDDLFNDWID